MGTGNILSNMLLSGGSRVFETKETIEFVGFFHHAKGVHINGIREDSVNLKLVLQLVKGALEGEKGEIDGFIYEEYTDMVKQLKSLCQEFFLNSSDLRFLENRQHLITFPSLHCFNSIQFLIRNYKVFTIVSMRSCDIVNKFEKDFILSAFCGSEIADSIKSKSVDVIFQIGSFHAYKKDLDKP